MPPKPFFKEPLQGPCKGTLQGALTSRGTLEKGSLDLQVLRGEKLLVRTDIMFRVPHAKGQKGAVLCPCEGWTHAPEPEALQEH